MSTAQALIQQTDERLLQLSRVYIDSNLYEHHTYTHSHRTHRVSSCVHIWLLKNIFTQTSRAKESHIHASLSEKTKQNASQVQGGRHNDIRAGAKGELA